MKVTKVEIEARVGDDDEVLDVARLLRIAQAYE